MFRSGYALQFNRVISSYQRGMAVYLDCVFNFCVGVPVASFREIGGFSLGINQRWAVVFQRLVLFYEYYFGAVFRVCFIDIWMDHGLVDPVSTPGIVRYLELVSTNL